MRDRLMVYLLT